MRYVFIFSISVLVELSAQNVGIGVGQPAPQSTLAIVDNLSIGTTFSTLAAPSNGMIVEGTTGIGNETPYFTFDIWSNDINDGARIYGDTATTVVVEAPTNSMCQLAWFSVGGVSIPRFTLALTTDSLWLLFSNFDDNGTWIGPVAAIYVRTGFVALNASWNVGYRVTLDNIADGRGRGIANDWLSLSDKRIKSNINPIDTAYLELLTKLPIYKYRWKNGYDTSVHIGLVAQHVPDSLPIVFKYQGLEAIDYWQLLAVGGALFKYNQHRLEHIGMRISELNDRLKQLRTLTMQIDKTNNETIWNN